MGFAVKALTVNPVKSSETILCWIILKLHLVVAPVSLWIF